ncbi:MAG: restriction endonuclease subunit S [Lachnospiraceae bacterium]|nr:restriction endonuclease subunit S [Lachnospiraceae bacterium]
MARGKKKQELTLEEKLEQALVPVEEQPYEVPGNWCWTRLEHIADGFQYGYTEKATYERVGPKYIRITDIGNGEINEEDAPYCKVSDEVLDKYKIKKNDILIARMGSVGENGFAKIDMNAVFASYLIRIKPKIAQFYIKYYFQSSYYWIQITDKSQGTTRMNVNANVLRNIYLPLPPLQEQQRIVEKIESLFAKLNEVQEDVSNVLQISEQRKLALINHAFIGKLAGITDVCTVPLVDIVEDIKIGPFGSLLHKEDYIENGVPVINPKHINKQKIIPDKKITITSKKAKELSAYVLLENDIIMGRRGEMGRTAPVSLKEEGYICGTGSLIIRLKKGFRADFYSHILTSQGVVKYLEQNCVGSTMKNLNEKIVRRIPVPYFTMEQQDKLMFRLESFLEDEKQILEKAEGMIGTIDLMKKSILAKAFRGELGTNNPEEQPAIEVLKTIFMEL